MKYERLKTLLEQPQLSIREMREKDQLVNELLPLMMELVRGSQAGFISSALEALEEA